MRAASLRLAFGCAAALLLMGAAPDAHGKEQFPGEIARDLRLGYDPPCRLCHIQGTTGSGSVITPFAISMQAHGLTGSASSIAPALQGLGADRVDSDGDGKPDVEELVANTDPNSPANAPLGDSAPTYGCSAAGATLSACLGELVFGALLVAGALLARRGKRRHVTGSAGLVGRPDTN
jgi:hypothetical protein